jgi:hypothetical protein
LELTGLGANSPAKNAVIVVNIVRIVSGFVASLTGGTKTLIQSVTTALAITATNAQMIISQTLLLVF